MSAALEEKPKNDMDDVEERSRRRLAGPLSRLYVAPWWLIFLIFLCIFGTTVTLDIPLPMTLYVCAGWCGGTHKPATATSSHGLCTCDDG